MAPAKWGKEQIELEGLLKTKQKQANTKQNKNEYKKMGGYKMDLGGVVGWI